MIQYERCLSNLSYTNKDFGQIYPELLDLAKKISYKWDPSLSDESDPGVVLLKLAALMADKNNYNIDKNILELFPLSVTQEANARQLFEQCGYYMQYYRSAETTLSLSLISEPEIKETDLSILSPSNIEIDLTKSENNRTYVLPMFTMFSDIDNSIIYTILADVSLRTDGLTKDVHAIQGIINDFTINGETLITASNLDYNNRLYFPSLSVPYNGIFISDANSSIFNFNDWKQVDNLMLQPAGTKCYKFSLTVDGSACYIEFPDDIESIIGNGIKIKYVITTGIDGNIGKNRISKFYADTNVERYINTYFRQSVLLTGEHISISNANAATNGANPESIDSAYKNYQKVKETFKTLVSLRDYENFLYTEEIFSNGFVCDRTNDIQSSYKILEVDAFNESSQLSTCVRNDVRNISDGNVTIQEVSPEMTPFDLRLYGFTYVGVPTTKSDYVKSFTLVNPNATDLTDWNSIFAKIDDVKFVQHNFKNYEQERILLLKNKYPIVSKIIPLTKLTLDEENEVKAKINYALLSVLNSRNVNFGEQADYSLIYDTILNADSRIRAVTLDEIYYETYAVYLDKNNEIQEVQVDTNAIQYERVLNEKFPKENTTYYAYDSQTNSYEIIETDPTREFVKYIQYYTKVTGAELIEKFQDEIFVQNVLAGKTQLFEPDSEFNHSIAHSDAKIQENITHITTETEIPAEFSSSVTDNQGNLIDENIVEYVTPTLTLNENIIFLSPNTINVTGTFGSYVKYIHNIGIGTSGTRDNYSNANSQPVIISNGDEYTLKEDEYIIFFWKDSDDENAPYTYHKFTSKSEGNIVQPTNFGIKVQTNPNNTVLPVIPESIINAIPDGLGSTDKITKRVVGTTQPYTEKGEVTCNMSLTEYINSLIGNGFVLTGSTGITMKKPNMIEFNVSSNTTRNIFWSLLDQTGSESILFDEGEDTRILQTGEYLFYTNTSKTNLYVLGYGTIIRRTGNIDSVWSCENIDNDKFVSDDLGYLNSRWFVIPEDCTLQITETTYHQIGQGNTIKLVLQNELSSIDKIPNKIIFKNFNSADNTGVYDAETGDRFELAPFRISYTNAEGIETILPLKCNEQTSWIGYSLLNINMSTKTPMQLTSRQKLIAHETVYNQETNKTEIIDHEFIGDGTLLQSNIPLSHLGGYKCDVRYLNLLGDYYPLNIYSYKYSKLPEGTTVSNLDVKWTITDNNLISKDLNFNLVDGNYVLAVYIPVNVEIFNISDIDTGKSIPTIDGLSNCTKAGTYYFILSSDISNIRLNAKYNPTEDEVASVENASLTILLKQLLKYKLNMTEEEYSRRLEYIIELDKDRKYDYTYVVPAKNKVENPLKSSSFFDKNHVFNQYTISEWNVSSEDTLVSISRNIK